MTQAAARKPDLIARVRDACHGAAAGMAGRVIPHGSPHSDYAFGVLSYLAADLGEAVASLQRSREAEPTARTAYALGLARAGRGDWSEALAAFLDAVELEPGLLDGYYQAAGALRRLGRAPEAADLLRRAVQRFRGTTWAPYLLNELGVSLQLQGDEEGAMESFREAAAHDGGDRVAAWANLALLLERRGRHGEAREVVERILAATAHRRSPHPLPRVSFLVFHVRGNLEFAAERPAEACRWYEKALEHAPESAPGWNSLAVAHHAAGRPLQARSALDRALAVEPGYEPARRNLEALEREAPAREERTA